MTQVDVEAKRSTNQALGSLSVNFTVYLSGASTLSTIARIGRLGLSFVVKKRSNVYFTSSATSSRPLTGGLGCQRTPPRSLKKQSLSPLPAPRSPRGGWG